MAIKELYALAVVRGGTHLVWSHFHGRRAWSGCSKPSWKIVYGASATRSCSMMWAYSSLILQVSRRTLEALHG